MILPYSPLILAFSAFILASLFTNCCLYYFRISSCVEVLKDDEDKLVGKFVYLLSNLNIQLCWVLILLVYFFRFLILLILYSGRPWLTFFPIFISIAFNHHLSIKTIPMILFNQSVPCTPLVNSIIILMIYPYKMITKISKKYRKRKLSIFILYKINNIIQIIGFHHFYQVLNTKHPKFPL